jgi:uncharacterized protein (TIGR03435 family)
MMKRVTVLVGTALLVAISYQGARAQSSDQKPLAFEVASIKPNTSGSPDWGMCCPGAGEFTAKNASLDRIVAYAFSVRDEQIIKPPSWTYTDRYDIVAKYPSTAERNLRETVAMLRGLLAERFNLQTHHETRELQVYALVLARRDRRLGPFLRPSTQASPLVTAPGVAGAHAAPISLLTLLLSGMVQRLVVDRTGLTGTYDYELHWTPEATAASEVSPASDNPSIFTAVEEQLGLKLQSTKAPVDVLVIDHVGKPTPD